MEIEDLVTVNQVNQLCYKKIPTRIFGVRSHASQIRLSKQTIQYIIKKLNVVAQLKI